MGAFDETTYYSLYIKLIAHDVRWTKDLILVHHASSTFA